MHVHVHVHSLTSINKLQDVVKACGYQTLLVKLTTIPIGKLVT